MKALWTMKKQDAVKQANKPKVSAAQIRVQKDLDCLDVPPTMQLNFPQPDDILHFDILLKPDDGIYTGGSFKFTVSIDNDYPHSPPKVQCTQKIYHPNIDLEGKVCLNILRKDWKPVLNLNAILFGIQYLFLEPNPTDPLNQDAANDMSGDLKRFTDNVKRSMKGGVVNGVVFDRVG